MISNSTKIINQDSNYFLNFTTHNNKKGAKAEQSPSVYVFNYHSVVDRSNANNHNMSVAIGTEGESRKINNSENSSIDGDIGIQATVSCDHFIVCVIEIK